MADVTDSHSERDEIRDQYRGEPGKGHQVQQAINEITNQQAYGHDTTRAERTLTALGHDRGQAASTRAAAAAGDAEAGRKRAPRGRSAAPRSTTASGSPEN